MARFFRAAEEMLPASRSISSPRVCVLAWAVGVSARVLAEASQGSLVAGYISISAAHVAKSVQRDKVAFGRLRSLLEDGLLLPVPPSAEKPKRTAPAPRTSMPPGDGQTPRSSSRPSTLIGQTSPSSGQAPGTPVKALETAYRPAQLPPGSLETVLKGVANAVALSSQSTVNLLNHVTESTEAGARAANLVAPDAHAFIKTAELDPNSITVQVAKRFFGDDRSAGLPLPEVAKQLAQELPPHGPSVQDHLRTFCALWIMHIVAERKKRRGQ